MRWSGLASGVVVGRRWHVGLLRRVLDCLLESENASPRYECAYNFETCLCRKRDLPKEGCWGKEIMSNWRYPRSKTQRQKRVSLVWASSLVCGVGRPAENQVTMATLRGLGRINAWVLDWTDAAKNFQQAFTTISRQTTRSVNMGVASKNNAFCILCNHLSCAFLLFDLSDMWCSSQLSI